MSRAGKRFMSSGELPFRKDADGKPLCRWCGAAVVPPRRSWCSQPCVDEFLMRSSAVTMRKHMFARDNGVCADCGCDTEKIKRILSIATESFAGVQIPFTRRPWAWWSTEVFSVFEKAGFNWHQSLWEADHVLEVINGGETRLDNMQTLCVPCHKAKTKRMHAERAQARRDQKRGLLETTA